MNIGTLTTHSAHNYGAALQAYALSTYIDKHHGECRIINYRPHYTDKAYSVIRKPNGFRGMLYSAAQLKYYSALKTRYKRFEAFQNDFMKMTRAVTSHDELIELANSLDCVFFGSDQIWNPSLHKFDEAYFMSMEGVTVPRISYAASFGSDHIDSIYEKELQRRLTGFVAFGARERSAQKLIKELTEKDSAFVLDPVFLLSAEEWRDVEIAEDLDARDMALLYFLSNPLPAASIATDKALDKCLNPVSIGFSPRDFNQKYSTCYSLGPRGFLSAIDNAKVLITNSFHGTAFAIIFNKQFFTRIQTSGETRNQRIISLLEALGLEDRIVTNDTIGQCDFATEIDYGEVNRRLEEYISVSKSYISSCASQIVTACHAR